MTFEAPMLKLCKLEKNQHLVLINNFNRNFINLHWYYKFQVFRKKGYLRKKNR